jgi:ATP-binding cassette subfamily B multidrug efflux pump
MFSGLFDYFESRIAATSQPPAQTPPQGLLAFYWHFLRQSRGLFFAMLVSCLLVALSDTVMPLLIGKLVGLMTATEREIAVRNALPMLGLTTDCFWAKFRGKGTSNWSACQPWQVW